jgi:hypothetical protein
MESDLVQNDTANADRPANVQAALDAIARGYSPLPIHSHSKKPAGLDWTRGIGTTVPAEVEKIFRDHAEKQHDNIGLLLGDASGGLIDIDLDHPKTRRLKDHFMPPTAMRSGRAGRPGSHYWYMAKPGTLQGYRKYTMPKKADGKTGDVIVEYRSTGGQSVIPPSIHPSGESYRWEGDPWGGTSGPALIDGRVLQVQAACLALAVVLLDNWPMQGSRHEAYLALAGGLLWYGDREVHPFWEKNVGVLIEALAEATLDEDGGESRKAEVLRTTLNKIRDGRLVQGFGKLADIIGLEHVKQARILIGEVESAAGYVSRQASELPDVMMADPEQALDQHASEIAAKPMEERDPLEDRLNTWQTLDLEPYLAGRVKPVEPAVLERMNVDGSLSYLMYPGRVNMLFGSSESAKSWIALQIARQMLSQRVLYLDMEDDPVNTLGRLFTLGSSRDDLDKQFYYIRPEEPLAPMQRNRWGKSEATPGGQAGQELFEHQLALIDPGLIILDGMSVLYGLHGLNTNDTVDTDVITSWAKKLTRNGRSTVIIIDHTGKGAERGSMPIGSQHKVSMVQGTLLQVWPVAQPMPGALGKVELIVLKDRPGEVRKISMRSNGGKAQLAAEVTMDSRQPGQVIMDITEPMIGPIAGNVTADLKRQRDADKAARRHEEEELIFYAFEGRDDLSLSMAELSGRLPDGFIWRTLKSTGGGYNAWRGPGVRALTRLSDPDRPQGQAVFKVGNTRDARYMLSVGLDGYNEMPDWDGKDDEDDKDD